MFATPGAFFDKTLINIELLQLFLKSAINEIGSASADWFEKLFIAVEF